jgi:hypothetical protein
VLGQDLSDRGRDGNDPEASAGLRGADRAPTSLPGNVARLGRRLPLLGPAGPRRRRRATHPRRPAARAERRNESTLTRELHERAIPALQS